MRRGVPGAALALLILAGAVSSLSAAAIAHSTQAGTTIVATDGRLRAFTKGLQRWTAEGVKNPSTVVIEGRHGVVLDPLNDSAVLFDVETGDARTVTVHGGPSEALFIGDALYLVARDAGELVRISGDLETRVGIGREPAFLRETGGRLLVYSRIDGTLSRFTPELLPDKRLQLAPFASDLETDGFFAYLVFPRQAAVVSVSLATFAPAERLPVGAVPIDLAVVGERTALTAAQLAVADPGTRKIWREEGSQSSIAAFGRGLLRGAIGLGLYKPKSPDFPTGIDRLYFRDRELVAYDSVSRTLFLVRGVKVRKLVSGVAHSDVAFSDDGVTWWDERSQQLRHIPFDS